MAKVTTLLLAALVLVPAPAHAWPKEDFTENGVGKVPTCAGVYIIYRNGSAYYIGRSRSSIRDRLQRHVKGTGSRMVASLLGGSDKLTVEYECADSVEQMEAQLIHQLGTSNFGNLRKETDPADWDN